MNEFMKRLAIYVAAAEAKRALTQDAIEHVISIGAAILPKDSHNVMGFHSEYHYAVVHPDSSIFVGKDLLDTLNKCIAYHDALMQDTQCGGFCIRIH